MNPLRGRRGTVLIAAVVAVAAVGSAGVARLLRDRASGRVFQLEQHALELQQELEQAEEETSPGAAVAPRAVMSQVLLDGPDVVVTMQELQQLADGTKVTIDDLRALPSIERDRQGFELEGFGSPDALCGFLAAIESSPRLMIVENGRITAHDDELLGFTLGVATYHREEVQR